MGDDGMGMTDEQFKVFTGLQNFIDELIDQYVDDRETRLELRKKKKNILAGNTPVEHKSN